MNKTIWKYALDTTDEQTLLLPKDAEILTVQVQFGVPSLWVLVNPTAEIIERTIFIYGTGHPIRETEKRQRYIGTYRLSNGELIFHVFELVNYPVIEA